MANLPSYVLRHLPLQCDCITLSLRSLGILSDSLLRAVGDHTGFHLVHHNGFFPELCSLCCSACEMIDGAAVAIFTISGLLRLSSVNVSG